MYKECDVPAEFKKSNKKCSCGNPVTKCKSETTRYGTHYLKFCDSCFPPPEPKRSPGRPKKELDVQEIIASSIQKAADRKSNYDENKKRLSEFLLANPTKKLAIPLSQYFQSRTWDELEPIAKATLVDK